MAWSRRMSGAVFLSYASQDAGAARRICDALRAAGVEVWLDQSELRGGDAWDQKIRRQIRECALFIPVISASTQSRSEGYFRREWKLGVERTHDMADHVAFLVPVVLDATSDREAHVPERFREVQWSRLPGGDTPAAFVDRIRGLLSEGSPQAAAAQPAPAPAPAAPGPRATRSRRGWLVPVAACAALAAAVALWGPWRKAPAEPSPPAQAPAAPAEKSAAPGPDPRSVAVLPFKNLSDDKENEYFSDGVSEELLTVLQKIPGLHVAAQTSAFYFKGKDVMAQEIGRQLQVANLVEGSVQRIGNRVRIAARLSRAATGEEIWAVSFPPRELTDVFALQDEIAQSIVSGLRGHLGGDAGRTATEEIKAQVQAAEKGGTRNAEAHELYLQGLFFMGQFSRESFTNAEDRLRRAVQLDPNYALAWAALSEALSLEWSWTSVASPAAIAECHDAARRSLELEPDLVEGYQALFATQLTYDLDRASGAVSSHKELQLAPENAQSLADAGILDIAYNDIPGALGYLKRAAALDPLNTEFGIFYAAALDLNGQLDEGYAQIQKGLSLKPNASLLRGFEATQLAIDGFRLPEALAMANAEKEDWSRYSAQALVYWALKRVPESDAALKSLIEGGANVAAYQVAEIYAFRNEPDKAFDWLERAYRQHDSGLPWILSDKAFASIIADARWTAFIKKLRFTDPKPY